jgi:putative endonuclease
MDKRFCIYTMANKRNGTIYIGVTNDLARRVYEHREGLVHGFTTRYGLKMLVHYEVFDSISLAIQRETSLKRWPRRWKLALIEKSNPQWKDLAEEAPGDPFASALDGRVKPGHGVKREVPARPALSLTSWLPSRFLTTSLAARIF